MSQFVQQINLLDCKSEEKKKRYVYGNGSKVLGTVSQINTTRCTILFNIFIYFSSLNVSGSHVPIIRRQSLYLCEQVLVTLYGWRLLCWLDWFQSNQQTRRHHTEWQVNMSHGYSYFLLMVGTWMPETCREEK